MLLKSFSENNINNRALDFYIDSLSLFFFFTSAIKANFIHFYYTYSS